MSSENRIHKEILFIYFYATYKLKELRVQIW